MYGWQPTGSFYPRSLRSRWGIVELLQVIFLRVNDIVMKEEKLNRESRVTIRFSANEFEKLNA